MPGLSLLPVCCSIRHNHILPHLSWIHALVYAYPCVTTGNKSGSATVAGRLPAKGSIWAVSATKKRRIFQVEKEEVRHFRQEEQCEVFGEPQGEFVCVKIIKNNKNPEFQRMDGESEPKDPSPQAA